MALRLAQLGLTTLLLALVALAQAQVNTTPVQPVNTPPPASAWSRVRTGVQTPVNTPYLAPLLLPSGQISSPQSGNMYPWQAIGAAPSTPPSGSISLNQFLERLLWKQAKRAYIIMPPINPETPVAAGQLGEATLKDPETLVGLILQPLGLELMEKSGIWVVQPSSSTEGTTGVELWVYTPKHRPLSSLAAYFPTFPRLSFNYSAYSPARGGDVNRTSDYFPVALPATSGYAWPVPDVSTIGTVGLPGGSLGVSAAGIYGAGLYAGGTNGAAGATSYSTPNFGVGATTVNDPSLLIVRGQAQDIAVFREFLERVDIPVPEVMLRVHVMEVRDIENRDSAVQLLLNLLNGQLTAKVGTEPKQINRVFLGDNNVSLAISRLTSDSRVRLISSPTLRASDGTMASVTIGNDTPTLGSIVTFSGSTQQSITYQSSGVLLNISPHILNDSIRLMIWQEVSSFAQTQTGLTSTPTKLRRALRTDVVARNGEVLLLGGLAEISQSETRDRSWFGLGTTAKQNAASEIVILLQVLKI